MNVFSQDKQSILLTTKEAYWLKFRTMYIALFLPDSQGENLKDDSNFVFSNSASEVYFA